MKITTLLRHLNACLAYFEVGRIPFPLNVFRGDVEMLRQSTGHDRAASNNVLEEEPVLTWDRRVMVAWQAS